jgi:hypothetical protein
MGMRPFRWNLTLPEQLGSLIHGERSDAYPKFESELRACASQVIAYCDNGELFFVGRSPESLFDYLSGVFDGTTWARRLHHLNVSHRYDPLDRIDPHARASLREYFSDLHAGPAAILSRPRPTTFIDLVSTGATYGKLIEFLLAWGQAEGHSSHQLRERMRFVAIIQRTTRPKPKARHWWQGVAWPRDFRLKQIRNIVVSYTLWDYLGNQQPKVARTHPPEVWKDESMQSPPREEENLKALRRAADLVRAGLDDRDVFSQMLADEAAVTEGWFRRLIGELRLPSRHRRSGGKTSSSQRVSRLKVQLLSRRQRAVR